MVFSSMTFMLLFLPIVLIIYFSGKSLKWRNYILLIASVLFYSWGEPVWILAMIFSTLVNFICAKIIDASKSDKTRKGSLVIGVIASLAFLAYFKYTAFFVNTFTAVFGIDYVMEPLTLPVGISFYTFQVLTYTVDVYRKKAPVQKSFANLLLYVSCFPQLIAGPIVQYSDVAAMIEDRTSTPDGFVNGMSRFIVGLSKKVLLANICGSALEQLTLAGSSQEMSVLGAWYSAIMYSLQIFFDFSAYSDMAIGLGEIFGFTYKENFNYPYISKSCTEFWRRWHISLGAFFRDYVYIPLGGNRCSVARNAFNILVVWALTGFWHGASWNFIIWGLYYGVILLFEKFVFKKIHEKLPGIITVPLTLVAVIIGWVIFYYTDFSLVWQHLLAMFGLSPTAGTVALIDNVTMAVIRKYTVFPIIAAIMATPILPALKSRIKEGSKIESVYNSLAKVALTVLLVLSIIYLVGQSYNPFIYFRF